MVTLVFMLEEESAKVLLENLLPRILPATISHMCIPHEGKQDLEKSIPIKLKHWNVPNTWFVIIRDKDQSDAEQLQNRLEKLCKNSGRSDSLVQLAIHELESWFLGDLAAVGNAFNLPKLKNKQNSSKFRNPDLLANASQELEKQVKSYQKVSGARKIAPFMDIENNTSTSFNNLITNLDSFVASKIQ